MSFVEFVRKNWPTFAVGLILFSVSIVLIAVSISLNEKSFVRLLARTSGASFLVTSFTLVALKLLSFDPPAIPGDVQFIGQRRQAQEDLRYYVRRSKKKLDVLGITLHQFFSFTRASQLRTRVQSGLHIRLFFLDPNSSYAPERIADEGRDRKYFKKLYSTLNERLKALADEFRKVPLDKYEGELHIYMYNSPTYYSLIRADEIVAFAPYAREQKGEDSPTFSMRADSNVAEIYTRELDSLARGAEKIGDVSKHAFILEEVALPED